jgi:hypothetical protein
VLNHVERGRILEQPAREHLAPGQLLLRGCALLHEHLNESAFLDRLLPRSRAFARRYLDDHIADPARFARLHHQVLRQVIALVEQADGRDAILHRRADHLAIHHRFGARRG